jgi:tetratricopeptide (TPR) repeat protein
VVGVVAFALIAGVLLSQSSKDRQSGESATGSIRQSIDQRLRDAAQLGRQGSYAEAIDVYDDILADDPGNPDAATYKGWMLALDGQHEEALSQLTSAATDHPDFPDVHALLAVEFFRLGFVEEAGREIELLDTLDPPPEVQELIDPLRQAIATAASSTTTSTSAPG